MRRGHDLQGAAGPSGSLTVRRGPVAWLSFCIVLAMVIGLFWLAIHFSAPAAF